jgi:hypothetical protein
VRYLALIALVGSFASTTSDELRAFERPEQPGDSFLPRWGPFEIVDSRRVASFTDSRGRVFRLYVAKTRGGELCVMQAQSGGAGGGCSPASDFVSRNRPVAATSGRLFAGVVSNDVAKVILVGSLGRRHQVALTRDGGFIHTCRAYNGCSTLIACIESYDRNGRLLARQPWARPGCARR